MTPMQMILAIHQWLYETVGRAHIPAVATEIPHGDARHAELWKKINDANGGRFDGYQAGTSRKIPLVALRAR